MYADDPIATIANFTAAGAFVGIVVGFVAERNLRTLEVWITGGVFCGGMAGVLLILLDALR